jgi:5-(carboxyamino)imidazole ribonucleotide mutase
MTAPSLAPLVGVAMGSASDLPTLQPAIDILVRFEIPHEVRVLSAHRTPEAMAEYARTAHGRGLQVLIAGAGGAAHLPGMLAASTPLPVIGVPVMGSALGGLDSLLSIVQMPRGVPVATVAINGGLNAGLLAVQILAARGGPLLQRLLDYKAELAATARAQDAEVSRPS